MNLDGKMMSTTSKDNKAVDFEDIDDLQMSHNNAIDEEFGNIVDTLTRYRENYSNLGEAKIYNRLDDYLEVSGDIAKLGLENSSGQNIFHRAARDLDIDTIKHILNLVEIKIRSQQTTAEMQNQRIALSKVVTAKDKNGLTPFHHACISSYIEKEYFDMKTQAKRLKTQNHHYLPPKVPRSDDNLQNIEELNFELNPSNLRQEVLKLLHEYGEKSNSPSSKSSPVKLSRDVKTGWNICHWLAFNNDLDCFKFLDSIEFDQFWVPNFKGEFPIDIAGGQGNRNLVSFLLSKLKTSDMLKETPKTSHKYREYENTDFVDSILASRFRGSLVVIYHYLFWACRYPSEESDFFVKDILEKSKTNRIYLEFKIHALKNQNVFHAVCYHDNFNTAKLLLKYMRDYQEQINQGNKYIFRDCLVTLNQFEKRYFDPQFIKIASEYKIDAKVYADFVFHNFLHPKTKITNPNYKYLGLNTFEQKDYDGNTLLHIAVQNGSIKCTRLFLDNFADLMQENGDHYKPLELIYHRATRDFFYEYFKKLKHQSDLRSSKQIGKLPGTSEFEIQKIDPNKVTDNQENMELLQRGQSQYFDENSVNPYYICSNWLKKNDVFGYTTERVSCCKRRGYLTMRKNYLEKLKPTLKLIYSVMKSNQPDLKNIDFAFKIQMKDGFKTQEKLNKIEFIDNLVFLLKSKGYHVWVFQGIVPGEWYIAVHASKAKLWQICIEHGIKRKVLGLSVKRRVGGWIQNEGKDFFGFGKVNRDKSTKLKSEALTEDWDDYGYECYENEINGTKFEPFTYREKQEIIYYDTNCILDIQNLIKHSAVTDFRWVSNQAHLLKIKEKIQKGRIFSIDLNIKSMSLGVEAFKTKPDAETSALDHYYGSFFMLKFRFFRFISHYNFLLGLVGLALQIYISVSQINNSFLTFIWYFCLSIVLSYFSVIWKSKEEEINILQTNPSAEEAKQEIYPENIEDRSLFKEQADIIYMHTHSTTEQSNEFAMAKYGLVFILFGAFVIFFMGLVEVGFYYWREHTDAEEKLGIWFFIYIKGLVGGVLVWIFKGVANLITSGVVNSVSYAFTSTKEDGKIIFSFMLKYVMIIGYPLFILYGKRVIFKSSRTDVETRSFLQGYCTILYFVEIIFKALWFCNPMGRKLNTMKRLMVERGQEQQQSHSKVEVQGLFRRGLLYVKPYDSNKKDAFISPEHVELEFERPYIKNCKSNAIYPQFMAEFGLSLAFCTILPIILLWNLFSIYLKTHIFLNEKFQYAAILETRRFKVPYVKPMFTAIFLVATIINFYHFYEYYLNFSSSVMDSIVGNGRLQQSRFWVLLIAEHFIIIFFIAINLFGIDRLKFVRKRRQTSNEKIYLDRYNRQGLYQSSVGVTFQEVVYAAQIKASKSAAESQHEHQAEDFKSSIKAFQPGKRFDFAQEELEPRHLEQTGGNEGSC